jgi:hypothetical protein
MKKKAENVVDIKRTKPGTHIKPTKATATQLFLLFALARCQNSASVLCNFRKKKSQSQTRKSTNNSLESRFVCIFGAFKTTIETFLRDKPCDEMRRRRGEESLEKRLKFF